jgi:hypothetical protein
MKSEYLYAIVDAEGSCWRIVERSTEKASLPDLLAEGWRPIRETPFPHSPGQSYILICLEREREGPSGFGFGR